MYVPMCVCRVRKNTVYQSLACFWPPSPKIPFSNSSTLFFFFFFFFLTFLCFFFSWCVTKVVFFFRVWCSLALGFRFGFLQRIEVQEALVFFEDFSSSSGYVVSVDICWHGDFGVTWKGNNNGMWDESAFLERGISSILVSLVPLVFLLLLLVSSVFSPCLGELGNISQRNKI
jgi:hypothetical protein